jgi:hypothetical protein
MIVIPCDSTVVTVCEASGRFGMWFQVLLHHRVQPARVLQEPLNVKKDSYMKRHRGRSWH